jgi:hypothetical protein
MCIHGNSILSTSREMVHSQQRRNTECVSYSIWEPKCDEGFLVNPPNIVLSTFCKRCVFLRRGDCRGGQGFWGC